MGKDFKKILITGGAGYVGTVLTDFLLKDGYEVRALDILRFGGNPILPFLSDKNYEFSRGDIRDKEAVEKAVEGIDIIIHLAAIVGFPACRKDPVLSRDINVNGTRVLVEAAAGRIPVLFASTNSTYGKIIEKYCSETTPLNPLSDYGKQKAEAEEIVKNNGEFVVYRFATAFGVSLRMRLDVLPNDFTYRAVREKTLIVYERNFTRSFIHVSDMARAFIFALKNYPKMKGEIYNVGDNNLQLSKEQICNLIKEKVDFYLHFADVSKDIEQRDFVTSFEKINSLGFKTVVSMNEGLAELIKAARVLDLPPSPYFE